jgi:hypothetical protein
MTKHMTINYKGKKKRKKEEKDHLVVIETSHWPKKTRLYL